MHTPPPPPPHLPLLPPLHPSPSLALHVPSALWATKHPHYHYHHHYAFESCSSSSCHQSLPYTCHLLGLVQALEQRGVSPDGSDLIRHNLVVFREGEGALQVYLPPDA